jgi:hypothetical protein
VRQGTTGLQLRLDFRHQRLQLLHHFKRHHSLWKNSGATVVDVVRQVRQVQQVRQVRQVRQK